MNDRLNRFRARPVPAHLERALRRYAERLGSQFAGAITYFSVLSIVPVLMLAFSVLGAVLTLARPDLLAQVNQAVVATLDGGDLGARVSVVVDEALHSWSTIGVVGLLVAVWSGAGWVANLKAAVRAQLRRDFALPERSIHPVVEFVHNVGILVVVLVAVVGMFAASSAATFLAGAINAATGLDRLPGGSVLLLGLLPLVVTLVMGFGLIAYLYRVLPETRVARPFLVRGSAVGAVGLTLLHYLAGALFGLFAGNAAAAVFGPVIVLMLFFNLFATLVLLIAAWLATAEPVTAAAPPELETEEAAEPELGYVRAEVAQKAMGLGLGAGYVIGTATGVGVGAVIAAVAAAFGRKRA